MIETEEFRFLLVRKLIHFLFGILSMASLMWLPSFATVLILSAASLMLIFDFLRRTEGKWQTIFLRICGRLLKPSEEAGQITGATTFVIAVAILTFTFPYVIIATSILILSISDPLASIGGKLIPIRKICQEKSLTGSLLFFISCAVICYYWMPISFLSIITISLLVTLIELLTPPVWENILIGLGSAALLMLVF